MSNCPYYLSRDTPGYGHFQALDSILKDGLTDAYEGNLDRIICIFAFRNAYGSVWRENFTRIEDLTRRTGRFCHSFVSVGRRRMGRKFLRLKNVELIFKHF